MYTEKIFVFGMSMLSALVYLLRVPTNRFKLLHPDRSFRVL